MTSEKTGETATIAERIFLCVLCVLGGFFFVVMAACSSQTAAAEAGRAQSAADHHRHAARRSRRRLRLRARADADARRRSPGTACCSSAPTRRRRSRCLARDAADRPLSARSRRARQRHARCRRPCRRWRPSCTPRGSRPRRSSPPFRSITSSASNRGFDVYGDRLPRGADGRLANERPAADVVNDAIAWLRPSPQSAIRSPHSSSGSTSSNPTRRTAIRRLRRDRRWIATTRRSRPRIARPAG